MSFTVDLHLLIPIACLFACWFVGFMMTTIGEDRIVAFLSSHRSIRGGIEILFVISLPWVASFFAAALNLHLPIVNYKTSSASDFELMMMSFAGISVPMFFYARHFVNNARKAEVSKAAESEENTRLKLVNEVLSSSLESSTETVKRLEDDVKQFVKSFDCFVDHFEECEHQLSRFSRSGDSIGTQNTTDIIRAAFQTGTRANRFMQSVHRSLNQSIQRRAGEDSADVSVTGLRIALFELKADGNERFLCPVFSCNGSTKTEAIHSYKKSDVKKHFCVSPDPSGRFQSVAAEASANNKPIVVNDAEQAHNDSSSSFNYLREDQKHLIRSIAVFPVTSPTVVPAEYVVSIDSTVVNFLNESNCRVLFPLARLLSSIYKYHKGVEEVFDEYLLESAASK